MIWNNLFSSWRIGESDSKSRVLPKTFIDNLSSFISCSCILGFFKLNKRKFREYFSSLDNSEDRHNFGHLWMVNHFRNTTKPQFTDHNPILFFPKNLSFIILGLRLLISLLLLIVIISMCFISSISFSVALTISLSLIGAIMLIILPLLLPIPPLVLILWLETSSHGLISSHRLILSRLGERVSLSEFVVVSLFFDFKSPPWMLGGNLVHYLLAATFISIYGHKPIAKLIKTALSITLFDSAYGNKYMTSNT